MPLTMFEVGNLVTCGFCGIETTVEAGKSYSEQPGFELGCGHRNGYCDSCKSLVMDASDTDNEIRPVCPYCTT